jgi:nitric-oxide synthase
VQSVSIFLFLCRSAITVFPPRKEGRKDFRVWNQQLISYAGYKNEDGSFTGDSVHSEFTQVSKLRLFFLTSENLTTTKLCFLQICLKLGWNSPRTAWDILPLIICAGDGVPHLFDIPKDLILEVPISHPK